MRFFHAGHSGDLIYSLPFVKVVAPNCEFYIASDIPSDMPEGMRHPNGHLMMPQQAFDFLSPLLAAQPYIGSVHYLPAEQIPPSFRLDFFRYTNINFKAGNEADWLRKYTGVPSNSHLPWLDADANLTDSPVICTFTTRYRNLSIDYSVLNNVENLCFLGMEHEFELFKSMYGLTNIRRLPVKTALEAAQAIKSARFYIGNQTMLFAIAEGLKVPRALETFEPITTVLPTGFGANDYVNNTAFQRILLDNGLIKGEPVVDFAMNFKLFI